MSNMTSRQPAQSQKPEQDDSVNGSQRLWSTPIGDDLAFLLARANALSLARIHKALSDHGLRTRSYTVLAIAAADARPSQRELSEFLRLDPSQIVSLIDQLERKGLVRREPDPRDRRANVVVATDAGRELALAARETVMVSDQEWFAVLPKNEQDHLASVLRTLAGGSENTSQ